MADRAWSIIVHGGARPIPAEDGPAYRAGCLAAAEAGRRILSAGGSALDATVAAIRVLEDDPTFNAGFGSVLNGDGEVECDAAIMDGDDLGVGGVMAVQGVRNPILAARAVLDDEAVLLAGAPARRFAQDRGVPLCRPSDLVARELQCAAADTVGCVARDGGGRIVAATSTGGLDGARPGRVGDSPLPGCGLYADSVVGGVALSGEGEALIRTMFAARIMHDLEQAGAVAVAQDALRHLVRVEGEGGFILMDRDGRLGWNHNSPQFAVAHATWTTPARAFLERREDEHAR